MRVRSAISGNIRRPTSNTFVSMGEHGYRYVVGPCEKGGYILAHASDTCVYIYIYIYIYLYIYIYIYIYIYVILALRLELVMAYQVSDD